MRFLILGGTGFVGKMLVPRLVNREHKVILIGRNKTKTKNIFPFIEVANYQELEKIISAEDVIVNLAVINNNQNISIKDVRAINVHFAHRIAAISAAKGAAHFINISSVHALCENPKSAYAITKKEAIYALQKISNMPVSHLFLPSIYGDKFSGKLRFLNYFHNRISSWVFIIIKSYKPTISIDVLTNWLCVTPRHIETKKILTDTQKENIAFQFFKRIFDITFCIFTILLFGWLMLLVALAIRLTSPGPAIFKHKRVGKDGRIFTCLKFRSMLVDTVEVGTHDIGADALTAVGKLIRKTKIDELPQIWNILANEMTVVGPRPCLPSQTRLAELRKIAGVDCLKPGITGLSQINKIDMSDPEKLVRMDRRYLDLQCMALDILIVLRTALGRGQGDPAQRI